MKDHSENIVKTADVIGKEVKSTSLEKLGKIEEIVLDKLSGEARYIVLSFGGLFGLGDKFYAFPWESISYDKAHECFILNIIKDELKNAKGFDKDNWPDMTTWSTAGQGNFLLYKNHKAKNLNLSH